eukprot:1811248-Rhodomonas_salina.1
MSTVTSGSFRQSDKRKGTGTYTLPAGKGMETEPLLVNDGSPLAGQMSEMGKRGREEEGVDEWMERC